MGADLQVDQLGIPAGAAHPAGEPLGYVVSVRGSQASVGLPPVSDASDDSRATVGKFLGVSTGKSLLIGVITDVAIEPFATEHGYQTTARIDLVGEIKESGTALARFQRGVSEYPVIGDPVELIGARELRLVFNIRASSVIDIGLAEPIGAYIDVNDMLSKHFAVLGTTGVGKSSGVVLILQEVMRARPDLRIFVLDPHNEYGRSFGERALLMNPRNLKLPFWLFNFEEIIDVFFGGRPGSEEEVDILSEVIPLAKTSYLQHRSPTIAKRLDAKTSGYTVDTPVPYRLADLVALLDERMGKLENRSLRMTYHRLMMRIETIGNDPRYAFMFENANVGGDTMAEVLSQLFRLPPNGKPMTVMQLAGFPSEVVDAVVSVICRMAFDFGLWSDGAAPMLFVCEEAHRYAAADRSVGFGPTRRSISRIAKEGRKYGIFIGLVTQRPAELDATILSQCSTLFAMRMTNDRDQALVRSAVADTATNLLAFLPSLGTREVFAFGEGVALPTRLKFKQLPSQLLPRSEVVGAAGEDFVAGINQDFIASVLERWRGATTNQKANLDDGPYELRSPVDAEAAPLQPAPAADPNRFRTLKRPLTEIQGGTQDQAPAAPSRWSK